MIDTTKNHVYVITVSYWRLNGEGKQKFETQMFTSNHSVTSAKFKEFMDKNIAKSVKGFLRYDEDYATQHTVPLEKFCK